MWEGDADGPHRLASPSRVHITADDGEWVDEDASLFLFEGAEEQQVEEDELISAIEHNTGARYFEETRPALTTCVIVDCFEDLFNGNLSCVQSTLEQSPAARVHKALWSCLHLDPKSSLYGQLSKKLTSALENALAHNGPKIDQKVRFLLAAVPEFGTAIDLWKARYTFEGVDLTPGLFHTDLLLTKHIQVRRRGGCWLVSG